MTDNNRPIVGRDFAAINGHVKELSGTLAAVLGSEYGHIQSKVTGPWHVVRVGVSPTNYLQQHTIQSINQSINQS